MSLTLQSFVSVEFGLSRQELVSFSNSFYSGWRRKSLCTRMNEEQDWHKPGCNIMQYVVSEQQSSNIFSRNKTMVQPHILYERMIYMFVYVVRLKDSKDRTRVYWTSVLHQSTKTIYQQCNISLHATEYKNKLYMISYIY